MTHPLKVAVIYHLWPHYREAVMRAMDRGDRVQYHFHGSGEPFAGIVHADPGSVRHFVRAPFTCHGRITWQPAAIAAVRNGGYDAVIFLADPHFASTWIAAALARWMRIPVLFWGHGWLRRESAVKARVRGLYFRLAHGFLTYSERGRRLGAEAGFPPERIRVVYNSLDLERADRVIAGIESGTLASLRPQGLFADPGRPLVICTARLTRQCRFDLLVDAAALLARRGLPVNVLLVGDGPAREGLEARARCLGVAVHFFGACYDEDITGQFIYHADLTVSPGKIGLTAMHSLMYGTPAITHDHFDRQMPEVEAIEEGLTGAFFPHGDTAGLAAAMERWLRSAPARPVVRAAARRTIRAKWSPDVQARIIEDAVLEVTGNA
ncbi:Glycosyltransferase involved in cell wall bisynthesis [Novosphingobium sp. CF614]|uniref:glycosyltransferase n=1 Tax=Novosphingobium sp. CF614 TaxID=1884364 RepID=UPI0008E30B5F|nr:glycosyltransferase [Novosphingobium sp. CF614]SFF94712.1 Glycosyltransferase involved in cell wall bisynthesis [Novosphingobium sp. CF614]